MAAGTEFAIPELHGVLDGITARAVPERLLNAIYYDTADLRLARWGASLRHSSEDGTGWTVTLPEGGDGPATTRRELAFSGPEGSVPDEVAALVSGYTRLAALTPVARVTTRRIGVELRSDEGLPVAKVVDDEVTAYHGEHLAARFQEVEVQLGSAAPPGLMDAVVTQLQAAGAGDPNPTPTVARALGSRAPASPELALTVKLGKRATAADAVRAAMSAAARRVIAHHAGVLIDDDPEDVHQARVGTRRLRSSLRTFRPLLEPGWTAPLQDELRWLAGLLGDVRDADVLLERLRRQAADLTEHDAHEVARLLADLTGQRETALGRLLHAMRGTRYLELLDRLVAAANAPAMLPAAERPATDVLPELVRQPWRRLRNAVSALTPDASDEELHRVRILAKRCRYAAEAATPAIGKQGRVFAKAVAGLQTVLGDHQDAVVTEDWLRTHSSEADTAQALVINELIAAQRADVTASRAVWRKAWKRASDPKLRTWLRNA